MVSFADAFKSFFKNYANFNGRARRSEYWTTQLTIWVLYLAMSFGQLAFQESGDSGLYPALVLSLLNLVVVFGTLVPSLAVLWRRLHDVSKSGGYYFIALIPIVGSILLLIELVRDSEPGPNGFGNPVK
jgi:uncharacterized membrane protein YhaH (DUF805 family)